MACANLTAAEIVITNCYAHWRKPASNLVHVCVVEQGQETYSESAYEVSFKDIGERQFLICPGEYCQLDIGIGFCEANVNNILSGHYEMVGEGQYIITTKREQLQLTKGNACP